MAETEPKHGEPEALGPATDGDPIEMRAAALAAAHLMVEDSYGRGWTEAEMDGAQGIDRNAGTDGWLAGWLSRQSCYGDAP